MPITREIFEAQRRPRFGTANPERMPLAFWEWMVRGDDMQPADDSSVLGEYGLMVRCGVLKSGYGPYRARDLFQVSLNRDDGPIWTFERMGRTRTDLPDGRTICVGGEHEDYYDPDFCIYNDVIVFGPSDYLEIYGYPKEVFPPTDFHTATLIGDRLFIIGGLGYLEERRPGHTPVYALDLSDYHISQVQTTGDAPGWLFRHEAIVDPSGTITIRNGATHEKRDGEQRTRRNLDEFALDTRSGVWHQLTHRKWQQFAIHQQPHQFFVLEASPEPERLYPCRIAHTREPCDEWNEIRFTVGGVPVCIIVNVSAIEVLIKGDLSDDIAKGIAEEVRANAEAAIGQRCVVQ